MIAYQIYEPINNSLLNVNAPDIISRIQRQALLFLLVCIDKNA